MEKTKYQKSEKRIIPRDQLRGADYNPRSITKPAAKRLQTSIRNHGLVGGIVWNEATGSIVGGHQRLKQLDELEGGTNYLVEVDVVNVSVEQEMQLNIALNNASMQGSWDNDKLAEMLMELGSKGENIERTGWTSADVFMMLGDDCVTGAWAEQRDTEKAAIDEMTELKALGKQAEIEIYGDEKLPKDTDGKEPSLAVPTPKDKPERVWDDPVATREALADRRKEYAVEISQEEDADTMITLVFDDNATRDRFLAWAKLDRSKRYFDRYEIETAFGVTLVTE